MIAPLRLPLAALLALLVLPALCVGAMAEDEAMEVPHPLALVEALTPPQTPGATRGITVTGEIPDELPAEHGLPAVALTIGFEFDSHRLTNDGMLVLRALGEAMGHATLSEATFHVAGHTDARGTDEYNLDLSRRRAETVVEHLNAFYGVAPERLIPVGYGSGRLAEPSDPEAAANRRVEIVNVQPLS